MKQIHERHEEWLHNNDSLALGQNVPILEINCNDEFKNNEKKKAEMLRAVKGFVASLWSVQKIKKENLEAENLENQEFNKENQHFNKENQQNIKEPQIIAEITKCQDKLDDSGIFSRTNTPTLGEHCPNINRTLSPVPTAKIEF